MIRTRQIQEVLQSIENEPRGVVSKENIFDNPVRIYLVIKSLYQNYKRKNVLQLMQERVFEIKLPLVGNEKYKVKNVSAANIFQFHQLSQEDLLLLIEMKEYLKPDTKVELYNEIFIGIDLLDQVKQVMNCYRALLNLQYLNRKRDMYANIEERMISKLLTMDLKGKQFKAIAKNLIALPIIKQPILILISKLYEKVEEIKDFTGLFKIFKHNFPTNPTRADLSALIRINLQETLPTVVQIIQRKGQLSQLALQIAQQQAKHKLQTMPLVMTSKTKSILNFIIQVVKFGRPIWHQIIEWEHKAAQQPKNFLKENLQNILISMLKDAKYFQTILGIIEKITEIDLHSQIGLIFVRQLLKVEDREYIGHRIIRRFLAIKILKYNSSQQYVKQIFGKGTIFIDIILEMFNFDLSLVINFYSSLIRNEDKLLENYLKELSEKMPIKFKEFYLRCNAIDKPEPVLIALLKLLAENATLQIAVGLIRDLALILPSRHILGIFTKFLTTFKQSKQIVILKSQIVRALNLALIRTPKQQINSTIRLTLPNFIKEHLITESQHIFSNVPEQTKEYLKKEYDNYLLRKKM